MMDIYPVFQTISQPAETDDDSTKLVVAEQWRERMEQLLLSDPLELMSFISDAILSIAARFDHDKIEEGEDPFRTVLEYLDDAAKEDRVAILEMVRQRIEYMTAHFGEHAPHAVPTAVVFAHIYKMKREEPWPWPKKKS